MIEVYRVLEFKLIIKLGCIYKTEINWYVEKLLKNDHIEINKNIISIKTK